MAVPVGSLMFLSFSYYGGPSARIFGFRVAADPSTGALLTRCPCEAWINSESQVPRVLSLDDGRFAFHIAESWLQTYTNDRTMVSSQDAVTNPPSGLTPAPDGPNAQFIILGSDHSTKFYVGVSYYNPALSPWTFYIAVGEVDPDDGSFSNIRQLDNVTSDGNGVANGLYSLCVDQDGVAYYLSGDDPDPDLATWTLKRYDLPSDTPLSDLTTYAPGIAYPAEAFALRGGNLIVLFSDGSLQQIDASDASNILTYTTVGNVSDFWAGLDDSTIWVWDDDDTRELNTTSGATVNTPPITGLALLGIRPAYIAQTTSTECLVPVVTVAPPLAPQTPCTPAAAIGSGGKGNSGCTVGGIGRTPTYAGAYGTVAEHADPVDGEILTDKELQGVEPWLELIHIDDPSAVQTIYRRAFVELGDPSTFEGGRKPRALISLGSVQNSLGNEQGMPEASTVDAVLSDADDRLIRILMATQELEGDEVRIKLASDALRNL